MAETRNIKDLRQSDAIASGDYFLIETTGGTQLLDFQNFVIDQDNTTFAVDLQTKVGALSSQVEVLTASVDITNPDSPIYIVNTNLTQSIEAMNTVLYGASFGTVLDETRLNPPNDPLTNDARTLDNNLQALSALVYDSVYSQITAEIAAIRGDADITNRDELVYEGGTTSAPQDNDGGLLGAVLDTAKASVDVFTKQLGGIITYGNDSITFTMSIPEKYSVNAGSLQFNIWYSGGPAVVARTDDNPYTNPGFFAITDFNFGSPVNGEVEYNWTIKRIGGKAFDDMVSYTLVTDAAGNAPTIPIDTDGDGIDDSTGPNPAHDPNNGGQQISTDDREAFPFTINGRVVVGLTTV